jgi:hypothetical protein
LYTPVKIETENGFQATWDLIARENLARVGIREEEIVKVEPFFAVPGTLYTEPGVASEKHPTGGSVGVWIYTETSRVSIQDIIYYDFNRYQTHYGGLPHWNHERRFIKANGLEERISEGIENHIIDDSETMKVSFYGEEKEITRAL